MKAKIIVFVFLVDDINIELVVGEGGEHVRHQSAFDEIINSIVQHLELRNVHKGSEMNLVRPKMSDYHVGGDSLRDQQSELLPMKHRRVPDDSQRH